MHLIIYTNECGLTTGRFFLMGPIVAAEFETPGVDLYNEHFCSNQQWV